ncbi:CAAX protease family protein [Arsenicicoccus piscis]|uniref:CAAX protease family protein n=1 Tax=Arsenicicoccus piscis TaxID=673954 RepID=A0ABQ6HV64_9MICO|nr:CAAX protease family protein [Arsenicicoccus piscis]
MVVVINPVRELRSFVEAALITPVPRDHHESDAQVRRRRIVAAMTLVVGAALLWYSLRIPAGDPLFYWATFGLAGVWICGALISGPLHLGSAWTRSGRSNARPVVQALALATLLVVVFCAGAVAISRIPALREPVDSLLNHARYGSLLVVFLIVVVNGIGEELYFRGALFAALGRRYAVILSTIIYTLTTIGAGVPLLVLAAAVLGLLTGLQRRVTGGILGPIVLHIGWSGSMLFLLPAILDALR